MTNGTYDFYFENSDIREAAKTLRMNIEFAGLDKPIKSVLVTSTKMAEGKSTVAISLAIAAAESGKNTLIIDNDFRNPRISSRLMIRSVYTLSDIFQGAIPLEKACVPTAVQRLYVLDLGSRRLSNPVEVLSSKKYREMLQTLCRAFDFVVIDTPPLGLFIDAAVVSNMVDGVIITVGSGKVTAEEIKGVQNQLMKANAHIIGVVLNGDKRANTNYDYYYDQQGVRKRKKKSANSRNKQDAENSNA